MAFTIITMGLRGIGLEAERYARQYLTLVPSCFARGSYGNDAAHEVFELSRVILKEARSWIRLAEQSLQRRLINQIQVDHIACLFHLVQNSNLLIAIAENEFLVQGLTGWGVEFAKMADKPLYVYNLDKDEWMRWDGYKFQPCRVPYLNVRTGFMGIKNVNEESLCALKRVFKHSLR